MEPNNPGGKLVQGFLFGLHWHHAICVLTAGKNIITDFFMFDKKSDTNLKNIRRVGITLYKKQLLHDKIKWYESTRCTSVSIKKYFSSIETQSSESNKELLMLCTTVLPDTCWGFWIAQAPYFIYASVLSKRRLGIEEKETVKRRETVEIVKKKIPRSSLFKDKLQKLFFDYFKNSKYSRPCRLKWLFRYEACH